MPFPIALLAGAAALGAGASIWGASMQSRAARQAGEAQQAFMNMAAMRRGAAFQDLLAGDLFDYQQVDAVAEAGNALRYTTSALPTLEKNAERMNKASARSFEDVMKIALGNLPGGQSAFEAQRSSVNDLIIQQLQGNLSPGTMRVLGRNAISSGASAMGAGSVKQLYRGFLGLTAEQISQQGIQNQANLVNTYRAAIPMTSAAQLMPYGGLSTGEAVQTAQQNAASMLQAHLTKAQMMIGNVDMVNQMQGQGVQAYSQGLMGQANAQASMGQAIAGGVGSLAGMYASWRTSPFHDSNFSKYMALARGGMK